MTTDRALHLVQALRGPTVVQSAAFLVGGLVVASAVAMFVGGLAGLIFSGIDLFLLGIAARISRGRGGRSHVA